MDVTLCYLPPVLAFFFGLASSSVSSLAAARLVPLPALVARPPVPPLVAAAATGFLDVFVGDEEDYTF